MVKGDYEFYTVPETDFYVAIKDYPHGVQTIKVIRHQEDSDLADVWELSPVQAERLANSLVSANKSILEPVFGTPTNTLKYMTDEEAKDERKK